MNGINKRRIKNLKNFFKSIRLSIKGSSDRFLQQERLLNAFLTYVPQYFKRTSKQHELIRKRVMFDPASGDCQHLKAVFPSGGRVSTYRKDYNVSQHTFADSSVRIRCNSCGKKWFKGNPDYQQALDMVKQSSNRPSSSEQIFEGHPYYYKNNG